MSTDLGKVSGNPNVKVPVLGKVMQTFYPTFPCLKHAGRLQELLLCSRPLGYKSHKSFLLSYLQKTQQKHFLLVIKHKSFLMVVNNKHDNYSDSGLI
jgi:hypothetical protein